jgi:hypothetical protein
VALSFFTRRVADFGSRLFNIPSEEARQRAITFLLVGCQRAARLIFHSSRVDGAISSEEARQRAIFAGFNIIPPRLPAGGPPECNYLMLPTRRVASDWVHLGTPGTVWELEAVTVTVSLSW